MYCGVNNDVLNDGRCYIPNLRICEREVDKIQFQASNGIKLQYRYWPMKPQLEEQAIVAGSSMPLRRFTKLIETEKKNLLCISSLSKK